MTTVFRINALIATLAMSFIVSGCASLVTKGNLLVLFDKPGFGKLARTEWFDGQDVDLADDRRRRR